MTKNNEEINETMEEQINEEVDTTSEVEVEETETLESEVVSEENKKIEELTDSLKRLMAEFENYRKRNDKEKNDMFDYGISSLALKILPVVDNFERGLTAIDDKENPFYQGMDKIYQQMVEVLSSIGVEKIEALGNEFDPELHNAIMHSEDDSDQVNVVIEEFQKGYKYKDKVIRYSMVKVLN